MRRRQVVVHLASPSSYHTVSGKKSSENREFRVLVLPSFDNVHSPLRASLGDALEGSDQSTGTLD